MEGEEKRAGDQEGLSPSVTRLMGVSLTKEDLVGDWQ